MAAPRAPFSILLHFQWVGQRRVQAPTQLSRQAEQAAAPQGWCCAEEASASPVEPDCARAPSTLQLQCRGEKGAKGLSSARRALCVCLPAFQYSSQSLRFLLWCCASERSGPAAHFPVTDTRTAQGHRDRSPSTGNTHQLHLRTQPFQDPVGSLRLLLQGGKGTGRKKLLVPSVTSRGSPLKPLLKPPRGRHKSHPCPREKAQLSLRTGTRGTMALKHPSRAQE